MLQRSHVCSRIQQIKISPGVPPPAGNQWGGETDTSETSTPSTLKRGGHQQLRPHVPLRGLSVIFVFVALMTNQRFSRCLFAFALLSSTNLRNKMRTSWRPEKVTLCSHPQAAPSTVGLRQSGESPGDREAQTVTDVCPHSFGSVYTETDRETATGVSSRRHETFTHIPGQAPGLQLATLLPAVQTNKASRRRPPGPCQAKPGQTAHL
ncbi:unnamed protein product [Pleuronectes platessa]|uniref:Uncharacterized protein n=1 Tax=Pleuronectes platessa TaxID=8262 RepID=A0A9N7YRX6_PLEPL|nr:unnamed protein product [Pleuronectes platessa]